MIRVKNLTKNYGKLKAVDNISFEVNKNEIIGFVGKNGAGKTTTIRTILNMLFPTKGEIKVDNLDSITESKKIKEILSYVSSDNDYYYNIKVIDLFKFCIKFSKTKLNKAKELSKYFELDINKKISELSSGNRKKVSIIQALLKENKIIIFDEPTNGLDPLMQKKFFDLILEEKKKGITIFLSSHNLNEVEKYCDRVIFIRSGKIVDIIDIKKDNKINNYIISYKTKSNKIEKYEYYDDLNKLLKKLSLLDIKDLEIRKKTIEEEFIYYYRSDKDE